MAERKTYREMLQDPRWQRRRLHELEAHEWSCDECAAKDRTLHVHHKVYWPGCAPWDYPGEWLGVLCDQCHKNATDAQKTDRASLTAGGYDEEFHRRIFKLLPRRASPAYTEDLLVELSDLDRRLVEEGCEEGVFRVLWPLTLGAMPRLLAVAVHAWLVERGGTGPRHPLEAHLARAMVEMQVEPVPGTTPDGGE